MKIFVTGGCDFIGSNFIRYILKNTDYEIINLDALTYSGNPDNLKYIEKNKKYRFVHGRTEERKLVSEIVQDAECIVNFAAESHVDRSILDPKPFIVTNIEGTVALLEACRHSDIKKFVHISTDEVYGELGETGKCVEDMPLLPNSYSASKACADLITRAYHETYGLPVVTARPSNNYGYYQYPEKFIPLMAQAVKEEISLRL
jgi:dTDP-glucose 4,6-dehydratase